MGAEIIGADFSKPVSNDDFARILQAFYDHQVLAIRDQHLSPAGQIAFSERFGALEDQLNAKYILPEHPEILILSNDVNADGSPVGLIDAGDFLAFGFLAPAAAEHGDDPLFAEEPERGWRHRFRQYVRRLRGVAG